MQKIKSLGKRDGKTKKAQISLFVILGILIIAGILIIYFIPRDKETIDTVKSFNQEPPKVANYVEDCVSLLGIEAFKKIGENGGYLNMSFTQSILTLRDDETESDILKFSESNLPYWWYLKTTNKCTKCQLSSNIPSINLIEFQVEKHIENNMEACLKKFNAFSESETEIEHGKISADVTINSDDVTLNVEMPIKIQGSEEAKMQQFRKTLDLRFKKIYDLAVNITKREAETQFLENITMGFVSIYGVADASKIPPITWVDHEPNAVFWNMPDVHDKVQKNIIPNVLLVQIENTKDAAPITGTEYDKAYNSMYLKKLANRDYKDVSVNFIYDPAWDIYLHIIPNSGGLLKASNYRVDFPMGNLPSYYTNIYEFFYDISYPVAVVLHDDKSLNRYEDDGYNFVFSMEANIRGNRNMFQWTHGQGAVVFDNINNAEISEQDIESGTCSEVGNKFKCSLSNKTFDSIASCGNSCYKQKVIRKKLSPSKTLFCSGNQKISKELSLALSDDLGAPVEKAIVSYGCGRYSECTIGLTDSSGKFSSKMPICINGGYLKIEKQGYAQKMISDITTDLETPVSLSATINHIGETKVKIKVIELINAFRFKKELQNDLSKVQEISNKIKSKIDLLQLDKSSQEKLRTEIMNELDNPIAQAALDLSGIEYPSQINDDLLIRSAKNIEYAMNKINEITAKGYLKKTLNVTKTSKNLENLTLNISESSKQEIASRMNRIDKKIKNLRLRTPANDYGKESYLNSAREMLITENASIAVISTNGRFSRNEMLGKGGGTLEITPGDYGINIFMRDRALPSINVIGGTSVDLKEIPVGSTMIDGKTAPWRLQTTPGQITFYVLRIENPADINELEDVGQVEAYSSRFRDVIEPEIS